MAETLVSIAEIRAAAHRIAGVAIRTPLLRAPFPGVAGEVWLKAESLQPIGAFKIRGAANKILQLTPEEIARGVITYSSGNHAQGVAYAARAVGAKAVIVMPSNAPGDQARCDPRSRCGGGRRGRGLERAARQGRGTGARARLHRGSAL